MRFTNCFPGVGVPESPIVFRSVISPPLKLISRRNPCPVFQLKDRHLLLRNLVALDVADCFGGEISHPRDFRSKYSLWRRARVRFNQTRDFLCAFGSFEKERAVFLLEITELGKDFVEQLIDRQPA